MKNRPIKQKMMLRSPYFTQKDRSTISINISSKVPLNRPSLTTQVNSEDDETHIFRIGIKISISIVFKFLPPVLSQHVLSYNHI
jgi:hypothetical protein